MTSAEFDEKKRGLSATVDTTIAAIDAGVPEATVQAAEEAICRVGNVLTEDALARMTHSLLEAATAATSSVSHLGEIETSRKRIEQKMANLPESGLVMLIMGSLYVLAALMAGFTELALTKALADLLGYGNV